ncbi:hypothetical protein HQ489_05225, partial [Candidatus Woesearchaeota archaeon]|nr:hypothetical protein [Candidatus Woesearchaeota archaeon]
VYTQEVKKDEKGKDVITVTAKNGIPYQPNKPENWETATGTCKKDTACLTTTSGDFAGRALYDARSNLYDAVPYVATVDGKKDGKYSQKLEYEIKGQNEETIPILVDQTCDQNCDKGLESDEKQVGYKILTADYTEMRTNYKTGVREYNTNQIGFFNFIDEGVGYKCNPATKKCSDAFFSTDNKFVCTSKPCTNKNAQTIATICNNDASCKTTIESAQSDKNLGMFFAGQQTWQKAGGQILNGFSGWSSISNALVGDAYANELATDIDRWFAGSILSEDYWESSFCYETASDVQEDGFAFIERPGGLTGTDFMPVAAIQAEMFEEKTPLLCMHNLDKEAEEEFVCPGKLFCNPDDSFCYNKEGDETPVQAFFYKISWGVTAPSDISFTPYGDESSAVEFNLKLGDKRLNDKTIKLKNGETDKNLITHYSDQDYENVQVCIAWVKAPITLNRKAETWDTTHPISDVCYTIKKAEIGTVIFTSDTATESVSVNNGKVTIDSSW